jgi:hypothetical protein
MRAPGNGDESEAQELRQKTLFSWNQIAQALAERSRKRLLQLAKEHSTCCRSGRGEPLLVVLPGRNIVDSRGALL